MKLAVAFQRFGPYHVARLKAAAALGDMTGIEFSGRDPSYAWNKIEGELGFPRRVCYAEGDIAELGAAEIRHRVHGVLGEVRADVVAIPGWSSPAAVAAVAWCRETRTPVVLMSDSMRPRVSAPVKERVKSRIVRLFSSAFVAGNAHADYVASLGIPRERIFTAYDVVDNGYFRAHAEAARKKAAALRSSFALPEHYFLAVGRFIDEKNIARLLEAYARYVQAAATGAWHLVLVGDGPLAPQIERTISSLGISGKVSLPGFKQYEELPIYYGLATALILASTSETWGLVVNEAMASGLPVLVSDHCGCSLDLVEEGINGFMFNPYDVRQLADRMLKLSGGGFDLVLMGAKSRAKIDRWGLEAFAGSLWSAARSARSAPPRPTSAVDKTLLWAIARR